MNRKKEVELERQEEEELFYIKLKYAADKAQREAFVRRMARGKLDAKKRRLTMIELAEVAGKLIALTVNGGYYDIGILTTHIGYVTNIDSTSFDLKTSQGVINISFVEVEIIELAEVAQ